MSGLWIELTCFAMIDLVLFLLSIAVSLCIPFLCSVLMRCLRRFLVVWLSSTLFLQIVQAHWSRAAAWLLSLSFSLSCTVPRTQVSMSHTFNRIRCVFNGQHTEFLMLPQPSYTVLTANHTKQFGSYLFVRGHAPNNPSSSLLICLPFEGGSIWSLAVLSI